MDYPNKYEEVTTEAKTFLEDFQTPEREKETAREMQRAQGNARRKAKAWRPNTSKSYNQEAEFDRAVDKLTSKVSQVEKERRSGKVFGLGGKTVAKPGTRTMSKIKGQRTAQQAADRDDREGKYMGVGEFSRSSEKATDLIAAAKKAKGRKEAVEVDGDSIEEVTTNEYTELLEVALITLCNKYELDLKTLLVELQTPERREESRKI